MAKKKLLLIDDERDLCRIVKLNLERTGQFEVTTAHSGQEGLEQFGAAQFALVITDFQMPDMDGQAVLEAIKTMKPEVPVILFSVYHDDESTITREVLGKADGLISKPIDHEKLWQVIQRALAKTTLGQ